MTPIDKDIEITNKKDDSFDFENSDELNNILGKYESTITTGQEQPKSDSQIDKDIDDIVDDLDLVEREVTTGSRHSQRDSQPKD